MTLDFSQNKMKVIFEITEEKQVALKEFCVDSYTAEHEKNLRRCAIAEVQISGENPDDHHGAKHTGTWGGTSLKYCLHKYYTNEFGNKLEFYLSNKKIDVIVHYQFYRDLSAIRAWTTVTNICDEAIGLEYVSSFAYTGLENSDPLVYIPHNTWCREVDWKTYTMSQLGFDRTSSFSLKRITASNTGAWSSKEYLPMESRRSLTTYGRKECYLEYGLKLKLWELSVPWLKSLKMNASLCGMEKR